MEFQTAKHVFAVGLILSLGLLDALIPGISIVGMILVLIGVHSLSQHYVKPDLFRNMLYAVIVGIIGVVIAIAVGITTLFAMLASKPPGATPAFNFLTFILLVWVIIWIVAVVAAYFVKKVYTGLYEASGVSSFKTAATLIWIGALTLVILVGAIIGLIGQIFAIIGAFELKPPKTSESLPQTQGGTLH